MLPPAVREMPYRSLRGIPKQLYAWRVALAGSLVVVCAAALLLHHAAGLPVGLVRDSLLVFILFTLFLMYWSPPVFLDRGPGPANAVTLIRAALVVPISVVALQPLAMDATAVVGLMALAVFAVTLDVVDGALARRTGRASAFGARFDMEVDAWLILMLSVLAWRTGPAGSWVLAIGFMRYAFVLSGWFWRWLERPLPPSRRRQIVCVIQAGALLLSLIPGMAAPAAVSVLLAALLLLSHSFAADVLWLHRHRREPVGVG